MANQARAINDTLRFISFSSESGVASFHTPFHHKRSWVINNSRSDTISSAPWPIPAFGAGKMRFSAVTQKSFPGFL